MQNIFQILSFVYIALAITTASTQRFWVMRRNYVFASSTLALLIFLTGVTLSSIDMIVLGFVTFVAKSVGVPILMKELLSSSIAPPKLPSRMKPTLARFVSLLVVIFSAAGVIFASGNHFLNAHLPTTIAAFSAIGISIVALGTAKSTYGQLFGVLMIENAFSLLILTLGLEFHPLIELGLLGTAIAVWLIMNVLSNRIRHVFGVETIEHLNELSE